MKVLMQSRLNIFSVPGGDTIQMLKTKEFLERLGLSIDISTNPKSDLEEYDIIHLFNLMRPQDIYMQCQNAIKYSKPIVLSTIYGPYIEFDRKARGGLPGLVAKILKTSQIEYTKIILRAIINNEINRATKEIIKVGFYRAQMEICNSVDVFLPNSENEMLRVKNDFNLASKRHIVIPNAVDKEIFNMNNKKLDDIEKFRDCVLCVARIEGRKCQLQIIKALKDTGLKIVFIGTPGPNSISYYKKCQKEGEGFTTFLGQIAHEDLAKYYMIAGVHVLVSWMETPGLSSLEAAVMGCPIVVTKKGDTYDYFSEYAYYCEPDNISSIRNAVLAAYKKREKNSELKKIIENDYSWEKAAMMTKVGYELALEKLKQ